MHGKENIMNIRILSVVAVMTLVSLSSGCSGMRNFLFGRGARCGLCNSNPGGMTGPMFGNTMQAPCGTPSCGQPYVGQQPGGGSEYYGPAPYSGEGYQCGTCGSVSSGDCGCGYNDPYMSSGAVGVPQSGPAMGPVQGDDFNARKFDADGSRIMWEEPYYGGTSL